MPFSVLVVEDEADWLEAICEMYRRLLDQEDSRVYGASSAKRAREMLQDESFDLLSLDLILKEPGTPQGSGDGRKLVREASGREPSKLHPVGGLVVVTKFAYDEEVKLVVPAEKKIERERMELSSFLQKHFGDSHRYFPKMEGMSVEESIETIEDDLRGELLALCNAQNIFRKVGEHWHIRYSRPEVRLLNDSKGLQIIHYLLKRPWEKVSSKVLMDFTEKPDPDALDQRRRDMSRERLAKEEGLFEKIYRGIQMNDEKARSDYRKRIEEIVNDLEIARDVGDEARVAELESDIESLRRQLGFTGTGGRVKDSLEKHRQNASKNIERGGWNRIAEFDEGLAAYLRDTIDRGYFCVYKEPDEPVKWLL